MEAAYDSMLTEHVARTARMDSPYTSFISSGATNAKAAQIENITPENESILDDEVTER